MLFKAPAAAHVYWFHVSTCKIITLMLNNLKSYGSDSCKIADA
jgi:hypothetical protein